jgi:hypothetical protein
MLNSDEVVACVSVETSLTIVRSTNEEDFVLDRADINVILSDWISSTEVECAPEDTCMCLTICSIISECEMELLESDNRCILCSTSSEFEELADAAEMSFIIPSCIVVVELPLEVKLSTFSTIVAACDEDNPIKLEDIATSEFTTLIPAVAIDCEEETTLADTFLSITIIALDWD